MIPKHCIKCWKYKECNQKEFMSEDGLISNGFIDFDIMDHVCKDCANQTHKLYPLNQQEIDYPAHCSICGIALNHYLTSEGIQYVKEAIAERTGCCRELWPIIWANYLE